MNTRSPIFLFRLCLAIGLALSTAAAWAIDEGRSLYIEGYAGDISYAPGDELQLHLSTTSPTYDLEIARVGRERVVVFSQQKIEGGQEYGIPEKASSEGCGWPVGFLMNFNATKLKDGMKRFVL